MKAWHVLTDEMIALSQEMFLKDHHWIAYNSLCYELGAGDLYFFRSKDEAKEFAQNNVSDIDNYKVIYASSIMNLVHQLSYGNSIGQNKIGNSSKKGFMNEENLSALKDSLKTLGFGDKLYPNLEHNIRQGFPEFILKMNTEFRNSNLESTLFFSRLIEMDHYLFYRYDAKLKNDVGNLSQSFNVKNGQGVTLKEAFNLLDGRAVYKEMTPNEADNFKGWIQLDLNTKGQDGNYKMIKFDQHYDYDLRSNLSKLPLKALSDPQKAEHLILSLQKGNLQLVTMTLGGKERSFFIQANPRYKDIDVYDYGALSPLSREQKAELVIDARQKLNGKEVTISGEQQGKEMKSGEVNENQKNENYLITTKSNFMNEKNLEHLKDNLKYLGFGEKLNEDLQKNLMEGKDSFQMKFTTEISRKPFEAVLNFRKSESTGNYFLNSYAASLEHTNGQRKAQTFYLDNGRGVTAKESYNLLEGRAVHRELENKEGQKYQAWIQLDFANRDKRDNYEVKQYHSNYGYDLKEAVSKFAVTELNDPAKEKALMKSLEKGNVQAVTIEKDGFTHKMFLEANPQYKTVNFYDANMKRVQTENMGRYLAVTPASETVKKEGQDLKQEGAKRNQPRKEDALMPKKRERQNKGLNIS